MLIDKRLDWNIRYMLIDKRLDWNIRYMLIDKRLESQIILKSLGARKAKGTLKDVFF
jgi:hypothetical protein